MIKKRRSIRPQVGTVYLEDNLMDENYASYYIDDQHYGTSYNDNPDIQGDDAKQFVFGSDWETWGGDEFGWY